MEKQRRFKVFSIVALMFAVVALSVGFAAFQKVLNISSSADVSLPSEENLKLTLYGVISEDEYTKWSDGKKLDYLQGSKEISYSRYNGVLNTQNFASIDNENLTININDLILNNLFDTYVFTFLLRNDSDYDVYVYLSEANRNKIDQTSIRWDANCSVVDDATYSLVNEACQNIKLGFMRAKDNTNYSSKYEAGMFNRSFLNGNYKLKRNTEMIFGFDIDYLGLNDVKADGDFLVNFDPIKLEFGLTPASYYEATGINEDA